MSKRHDGRPRAWYRTWMALAVVVVLVLTLIAFLLAEEQDTDPDVAPARMVQLVP